MCGILGAYNIESSIVPLLARQHHRGPDAMDHCVLKLVNDASLQLGHNRLKIICLSDDANQPLSDASKQHYLVFNGEIYNYLEIQQELKASGVVFQTHSDSEVLLQALKCWGMGALNKLNGMFAFAYFNNLTQTLYLVRDRFGVKPLYYFYNQQRLMFASTSAVIADTFNLQPNYSYLKKGLQYGIFEDDTDVSMYEHLKSVPAGSYIAFNLSPPLQPQTTMYYDLSDRVVLLQEQLQVSNPQQLQAQVFESLVTANHQRMIADVPIAVGLSGGLDSSTVAVLGKQVCDQLEAFCFGDPNDPLSEGALAQKLADMHHIKTHFVVPNSHAWESAFWQTLAHQDAPFAGISIVAQYLLYQMIQQHGFKVVLGGQGGDEAFLGYRKFQLFYLKLLLAKKHWWQAAQYLGVFSQMLWAERKRLLMFWRLRTKYAKGQGHTSGLQLPGEMPHLTLGSSHDLGARQIADVLQYSLPTLLRYEDRNSMAHGIESRLPFMDYRLMELACALPVAMKLYKGYGKWAIRESMTGLLPNDIRLARYKRGFDVTQSSAVFSLLQPSIMQKITEKKAIFTAFLPHVEATKYFSAIHLQRMPQRFTELMTLLWLGEKL